MALNIFKKKQSQESSEEKTGEAKKEKTEKDKGKGKKDGGKEKSKQKKRIEKSGKNKAIPGRSKKSKKREVSYKVLKAPHVTEKATNLSKEDQYIFKVFSAVNKVQVKRVIEELYGVNVLSVRMINVRPKARRLGKISGWRKGYKKAIVKIKKGQKIEILPK